METSRNLFSEMTNRTVLWLLIALAVVSLALSFFSHTLSPDVSWSSWFDGAFQNFSTEMMGAIVTFGLFELILGARQRAADREEAQQREIERQTEARQRDTQQRQFIAELNNQQKGFLEQITQRSEEQTRKAQQVNAIARLRQATTKEQRQPILDEMQELDLLMGADLSGVNLAGADLFRADLAGARLRNADLSNADLYRANLEETNLYRANLTCANLSHAELVDAYLLGAKLSGAKLLEADLTNADLERVTLPDGTTWEGEAMECFTDSSHPDYREALEQINLVRLERGQVLFSIHITGRQPIYPLPDAELDDEAMKSTVNAQRTALGLPPLE